MKRWSPEQRSELESRWADKSQRPVDIQRVMGLTPGQFVGALRRYNLHRNRGNGISLSGSHPAVIELRTLFPKKVRNGWRLLRPGRDNSKLGNRVTKGAWRGAPIFSLSLEERATCPSTSKQFLSCYGNNMPWAVRSPHGPELERGLRLELSGLQNKHPNRFAVRLHQLGDFYSLGYVRFWEDALDEFSGLRIFGYTHWDQSTEIGAAIADLRHRRWNRFAVRTSDAKIGPRTFVIDRDLTPSDGAILCPAQAGKTRSCGTCALCWSEAAMDKPIAFQKH